MEACLLHNITYPEYQEAVALSLQQCELVASKADLKLSFENVDKPGKLLVDTLDRQGFSANKFRKLMKLAKTYKVIKTYYKPEAKIAILIANDKYVHLSKLITPCKDCDSIGSHLKNAGFMVFTIKNCKSKDLEKILTKIFDAVPEKSYLFVFYAGHGCDIGYTKFILDVNCPTENITMDTCITEDFILKGVTRCKPELCLHIMDMCRIFLDRVINPAIFIAVPPESCNFWDIQKISNLFISCSTQSSQAACEILQIECSTTIDNNSTYELKTGDTEKIVPGASQYVSAFCKRFEDACDISTLLDSVHGDVQNAMKMQKPIKIQVGVSKRSLFDPVKGDTTELFNKLKAIGDEFKDNCDVF